MYCVTIYDFHQKGEETRWIGTPAIQYDAGERILGLPVQILPGSKRLNVVHQVIFERGMIVEVPFWEKSRGFLILVKNAFSVTVRGSTKILGQNKFEYLIVSTGGEIDIDFLHSQEPITVKIETDRLL